MSTQQSLLSGTAFITGGGSGIGQYTALAFVQNGVKNLTITDINEKNLQDTVEKIRATGLDVAIETIVMYVVSSLVSIASWR
jgi:NAD(P)-dependent dehydrogenase (short-subunit alcohol dehydrogenase family)